MSDEPPDVDLCSQASTRSTEVKSELQVLFEKLDARDAEARAEAAANRILLSAELQSMKIAPESSTNAVEAVSALGIAQPASFSEAISLFQSTRKKQEDFNSITSGAVSRLEETVASIQEQFRLMRQAAQQPASSQHHSPEEEERAGKWHKSEIGKGHPRKRTSSAEPQRVPTMPSVIDGRPIDMPCCNRTRRDL